MPPPIPTVTPETAGQNLADLPVGTYYLEVSDPALGDAVMVREGGHHFEVGGKTIVIWPLRTEMGARNR